MPANERSRYYFMTFSNILNFSTDTLTLENAIICTAASVILGTVIAFSYYKTGKSNKHFMVSLAVMPAMVQTIVMLVNGNLGTSVAIVGAFSLVRFRSVPGSSRDISSIFFAMVVGVATGTGNIGYASFITIFICAVILAAYSLPICAAQEKCKMLKVTIYENLDYNSVFDDLFGQYLKKCELVNVKTTNMGSMYQLQYNIEFKDNLQEKEFIDALRCRNGNLTIVCGKTDVLEEL